MSVEKDMAAIAEQELAIQFDQFGAETAWLVGSKLRAEAVRLGAGMLFEVQVGGRVLFTGATGDVTVSQGDWIRRKRNTVMWFGKSSYWVGLKMAANSWTLESRYGMSLSEYAIDGGGFPITLRGTGVVGSVIASGLVQREDHALVVKVLAEVLGVRVAELQ
jgi:uncharacterized protein (UPF0303 family)